MVTVDLARARGDLGTISMGGERRTARDLGDSHNSMPPLNPHLLARAPRAAAQPGWTRGIRRRASGLSYPMGTAAAAGRGPALSPPRADFPKRRQPAPLGRRAQAAPPGQGRARVGPPPSPRLR